MATTNNIDEKIIEKIKKLLRLSKSDNIGEATNAMRKAQEMMLRYGIKNIDADETKQVAGVFEMEQDTKSGISTYKKRIMATLAKRFKCSWYMRGNNLAIIGREEEALILKEVFEWICIAFENLSAKFLKAKREELLIWNRSVAISEKNQYLLGFCQGLADSLDNSCKETGLMVIVPNCVMEKIEELHIVTKKTSIKTSNNIDTYIKGIRDG